MEVERFREEAQAEYNDYLKTMRKMGVKGPEAREQRKLEYYITKLAEADKWEKGKARWEKLRDHREKVKALREKAEV